MLWMAVVSQSSVKRAYLRKPEHNYVQVDLSDFTQILQVGLLWGVDRHSKAHAKSFEGNHEIGIPLNIGPILARFKGLQTSHGTAYKNKLQTKLHQANISSP